MKLKPILDRVLVERAAPETTTDGGLIIPDSAQQKLCRGTVIDAGKGMYNQDKGTLLPNPVVKGDLILFSDRIGTEITVDGKDCLLLRECDVLAICDKN